jgi:hypothetical protein
MAGLKTLAKELQSKGRNGDTILAHINPQEAGILKALGGSGTRNPDTGLPEYFFKKITQPIVQAVKAVQNIPGIKQVSDVATQAVKPIDQALVGLDKTVGKAIPGGWGTVGQVALSAMGAPVPLQVGYGAARGGGILRPGSSLKNINLQGAVIGGATAYATAELGEYMRAAAPGSETASQSLTDAVKQSTFDPKTLVDTGMIESTDKAALNALSKGIEEGAGKGLQVAPPPSIGSELLRGNFGNVASRGLSSLENFGTSAVEGVKDFGKAAINPETYTGALDKGVDNLSQTGSGIKNLLTGPAGTSKAAAIASGVNPMNMTGMALYGTTSLVALDEQRKYLEEAKRANAISQAEYDQAMDSINRQRDYADKIVRENPFNPNPNRDVSIGETYYGRSGENENLYDRMQSNLYAMGGQVDDELGGDYSAMGMDQGNLQKGLFGMGYAAGGQIDMGNGYNPFTNLPPMSGPLGAVGQQTTPFSPERMSPQIREMIRVSGGGRDEQGRTVDGLGNVVERTAPSGQSFGQIMGGLSSILNQSTPQVSPSLNQNPNTNMGGFAGPSSFYGGGGGFGGGGSSGGPFPLEGQYGIVKMAAGGMPPRFLSGGGDGMSDSIKATINDNQPARLADGEFVIPADVVSHLGNGSSKAGAKQLYSMMDKVRKARTGNPKQGKQINPRKYMPA